MSILALDFFGELIVLGFPCLVSAWIGSRADHPKAAFFVAWLTTPFVAFILGLVLDVTGAGVSGLLPIDHYSSDHEEITGHLVFISIFSGIFAGFLAAALSRPPDPERRAMDHTVTCSFALEIDAPEGLAGIERTIQSCTLPLYPWKSGHSGKTILRARRDPRFEWDMDVDGTFAEGEIAAPASEAEQLLRSLSRCLAEAGFGHRILLDGPNGDVYATIEHEWAGEHDA